MANPAKAERNKFVVYLKDVKKMSFEEIRKELGFKAKSTAHEIYHREKNKTKLSTV